MLGNGVQCQLVKKINTGNKHVEHHGRNAEVNAQRGEEGEVVAEKGNVVVVKSEDEEGVVAGKRKEDVGRAAVGKGNVGRGLVQERRGSLLVLVQKSLVLQLQVQVLPMRLLRQFCHLLLCSLLNWGMYYN